MVPSELDIIIEIVDDRNEFFMQRQELNLSTEMAEGSPSKLESTNENVRATWLNWVRGFGFLGFLFGLIFNGPAASVVERFVSYPFIRTYVGGIVTGIAAGGMVGLAFGAAIGGIAEGLARFRKPEMKVPTGMPKILIVEDYSPTGTMIQISLEHSGYEITHASNGEEAIAAAAEHPFDLIVLDIAMAGMSGIEVCRTIRSKKLSDAPIIMFTATASVEAKLAAFDAGADDFITKPAHLEEFHARVNALLRRSAPPKTAESVQGDVKGETDSQEGVGEVKTSADAEENTSPLRRRLQKLNETAKSAAGKLSSKSATNQPVAAEPEADSKAQVTDPPQAKGGGDGSSHQAQTEAKPIQSSPAKGGETPQVEEAS